jgi:Outer membrane protein beta-barrel domain
MLIQRQILLVTLSVALLLCFATPARAQSFISPMVGVNFGGVSGCPAITDCTNQQRSLSISLGRFGAILGAETEVAYTPNFFGDAPGLSSNVVTMMGNVMLAPKAGPVRPYVLAGMGVMKTRFELRTSSLLAMNDTALGYALGGGMFVFFGSHFGLRGDVRYYHSFPDVTFVGITLPSEKLNYSRAGIGIVLQF